MRSEFHVILSLEFCLSSFSGKMLEVVIAASLWVYQVETIKISDGYLDYLVLEDI